MSLSLSILLLFVLVWAAEGTAFFHYTDPLDLGTFYGKFCYFGRRFVLVPFVAGWSTLFLSLVLPWLWPKVRGSPRLTVYWLLSDPKKRRQLELEDERLESALASLSHAIRVEAKAALDRIYDDGWMIDQRVRCILRDPLAEYFHWEFSQPNREEPQKIRLWRPWNITMAPKVLSLLQQIWFRIDRECFRLEQEISRKQMFVDKWTAQRNDLQLEISRLECEDFRVLNRVAEVEAYLYKHHRKAPVRWPVHRYPTFEEVLSRPPALPTRLAANRNQDVVMSGMAGPSREGAPREALGEAALAAEPSQPSAIGRVLSVPVPPQQELPTPAKSEAHEVARRHKNKDNRNVEETLPLGTLAASRALVSADTVEPATAGFPGAIDPPTVGSTFGNGNAAGIVDNGFLGAAGDFGNVGVSGSVSFGSPMEIDDPAAMETVIATPTPLPPLPTVPVPPCAGELGPFGAPLALASAVPVPVAAPFPDPAPRSPVLAQASVEIAPPVPAETSASALAIASAAAPSLPRSAMTTKRAAGRRRVRFDLPASSSPSMFDAGYAVPVFPSQEVETPAEPPVPVAPVETVGGNVDRVKLVPRLARRAAAAPAAPAEAPAEAEVVAAPAQASGPSTTRAGEELVLAPAETSVSAPVPASEPPTLLGSDAEKMPAKPEASVEAPKAAAAPALSASAKVTAPAVAGAKAMAAAKAPAATDATAPAKASPAPVTPVTRAPTLPSPGQSATPPPATPVAAGGRAAVMVKRTPPTVLRPLTRPRPQAAPATSAVRTPPVSSRASTPVQAHQGTPLPMETDTAPPSPPAVVACPPAASTQQPPAVVEDSQARPAKVRLGDDGAAVSISSQPETPKSSPPAAGTGLQAGAGSMAAGGLAGPSAGSKRAASPPPSSLAGEASTPANAVATSVTTAEVRALALKMLTDVTSALKSRANLHTEAQLRDAHLEVMMRLDAILRSRSPPSVWTTREYHGLLKAWLHAPGTNSGEQTALLTVYQALRKGGEKRWAKYPLPT